VYAHGRDALRWRFGRFCDTGSFSERSKEIRGAIQEARVRSLSFPKCEFSTIILRVVDFASNTFNSHKDQANFDTLEHKLSYEDIRFYRSIGRSQLRKERVDQKKLQAEQAKKAPPPKQGWVSWALGYSPPKADEDEEPGRDGYD